MKKFLNVEEKAKKYIIETLKKYNKNILEISLTKKGCGGNSYDFIMKENKEKDYEYQLLDDDFFICVSYKNLLFLINSEIYLEENILGKKLEIKNSKEKQRCGCGKSFKS